MARFLTDPKLILALAFLLELVLTLSWWRETT